MKQKSHLKSKIATLIIGVLTVVYAVGYGIFCLFLYNDLQNPWLLLYGIIPLALLIGIIAVVRMRLKELDKGELDEAKKY